MRTLGGAVRGGRGHWVLLVTLLTVCLLLPGPTPAQAVGTGSNSTDTNLAIGAGIIGVIGTAAIAYGIWENLPSRQGQPRLIKGEFYVGGYLGAAFTPTQNLKYSDGIFLSQVGSTNPPVNIGSGTVRKNRFDPAVVGGLKFGYFCDKFKYLGMEIETNFNRSPVRQQGATLSRTVNGSNRVIIPNDNWVNWTMALHLVARYGFFKDSEVPFGRLQPYVGIGPGLVVMYDEVDSAKNFALDVMAGVRYMMLKNVSVFLEYKFSHQWDAEMGSHYFFTPDFNNVFRGNAHLDYDSHKVVLGVAYHF